MKCPECKNKLNFRESSFDNDCILREQYICINGHVYESLTWIPVPKYEKIDFRGIKNERE